MAFFPTTDHKLEATQARVSVLAVDLIDILPPYMTGKNVLDQITAPTSN